MRAGIVTCSKPALADVTLIAATSVAIEATVEALESSMAQAEFAEVLLLCDRPPPKCADKRITWRRIAPLRSRADYSQFMLKQLAEHIRTSHALCVQWDGFVLNGSAWDPGFLAYDYIGAVWPQFRDRHTVGNGGFSLRSRRLLEACRELPNENAIGEDVAICRVHRAQLEQRGMAFATEQVARAFSYERTPPSGIEFGFHGAFNLVAHVPAKRALRLFRGLEATVLARREHLEIVRWAIVRGRLRLAFTMMARLLGRLAQKSQVHG